MHHRLSLTFINQPTELVANAAGALFLGIELEVVGPDLATSFAATTWPTRGGSRLVGVKSDCSLVYNGELGWGRGSSEQTTAELYTQPFSLGTYQATMREQLTQMLADFATHRVTSNNTCGMHIHVSQTAFANREHAYRFGRLFYRYPRITHRLSGRASLQAMMNWASCTQGSTREQIQTRMLEGNRYAVSFTSRGTIEVRIFAGTVDPVQFHRNIEAVLSGIAYTADCTFDEAVPSRWRRWVAAQAEQYPQLAPFFASSVFAQPRRRIVSVAP